MKKLNKIFVVTVFCVILISLFMTVSISADSSGICGEGLTWTLKADGTLVISGVGDMYDYKKSESPWYTLNESIKNIEIGDVVTSIGSHAFSDIHHLYDIAIPDNVNRIGEGAFSGCDNLNSITLPFVGERIRTSTDPYQYPFGYIFGTTYYKGSDKTEQSYYGEDVYQITHTTYYIPMSLKKVTITGGEILKGAFENCDLITSVILENDVTGIGEYAFNRCTSLMSITIGDGVTNIGDGAFSYCTSLQNITLPESVTSISDNAFEGCDYIAIKCNCGSEAFYYAKRKNLSLSWTCTEQLNNYVYNNDATCTEDGTKTAVCDICETPRTLKADNTALGHSFTNYASDNNATCIEDGTKTKKCRRCETAETITDENSALGHLFNNYFRNEDATCTADGTMTSKCFRCDAINTIVDKDSALGHTAGEWQITKEPKLGVEGEKVKCCTVCNEILETDSIPALIKEMTFTDVKTEHWYYNAVEYCFMEGIINGVGNNKFAPQTELSRAMLVRIFWNMEGCPKPTGDYFTDIGTDRWYTDAVNWAAENGIVAGMDSEHFCPEKSITREQLAAIMHRYSAYLGNDVSDRADLNNYVDADEISDWAYESLEWAVSVGIISGRSETLLTPKGTATRAETASIIMRFLEN